ncbi:DUF6896 domain-containing protein [Pseudoflavitalea rhizosphaerae]|uniref:DUF6896 domain-containing protein n=1 Tax=Pseudoflavitalea rhizosphaerae TaxID=1884793 RepID=UPI000F8C79DD|nr:hypothetical protein [Pseudoflavitalea rhizosphaerae]
MTNRNQKEIDFEQILFECVQIIKKFNNQLAVSYSLSDIPYNLAGKMFPKIGSLYIDGMEFKYRFHGSGCTIFFNNHELYFGIDPTCVNQIIITPGGFNGFLKTFIIDYEKYQIVYKIDPLFEKLEAKGVFVRTQSDQVRFHVNEEWIESYKIGIPFTDDNNDKV